jgi:catalase
MSKERQLVLELLLIKERYNKSDILRAIDFIESVGSEKNDELAYLVRNTLSLESHEKSQSKSRKGRKSEKERNVEKIMSFLWSASDQDFYSVAELLYINTSSDNRANITNEIRNQIDSMSADKVKSLREIIERESNISSAYQDLAEEIMKKA